MIPDQHTWENWSSTLHGWGVQNLVASFLEAAGPLTLVGAQLVYLLQPFLRGRSTQLSLLAGMLEDQEQAQAFAKYLREAKSS